MDDRENLKPLNICDPYVEKFFFGDDSVIVEGDTEYTALKYVRSAKGAAIDRPWVTLSTFRLKSLNTQLSRKCADPQ
jgi:hypothetical protein